MLILQRTVSRARPRLGGGHGTIIPVTTDAAPPRVFLRTDVADTPSTGTERHVPNGGDLQATLNAAVAGDVVTLAAGATWAGNYTIPYAGAGGFVTVRSDGTLPAEHARMTPTQAAAMGLPRIRSLGTGPAFQTAASAAKWRFIGLDISADPSTTTNFGLVALGFGDETSVGLLPTDILFDRSYIHGHATLDSRRGITVNSARTAIIDSWISDIHSTFDANGIGGWNGPGPFKYVNNTIQCSGVSIGSGGAHIFIDGLIPSDFEIRRNHMTKDLSWLGTWTIKNVLEFKNGQRALVDANILENACVNGQQGWAIVLWSADQDGLAPWSTTNNIMLTRNEFRNNASGLQLSARGFRLDETEPMHHITVRNNVMTRLNGPAAEGFGDSYGRVFQIFDGIGQLTIEHVTAFSDGPGGCFQWAGERPLVDHIVRNNLVGSVVYQLRSDTNGAAAWALEAGAGSVFRRNVVALFDGSGGYIPDNYYPATLDDIGLAGGASAAYSITATRDDLALASSSIYRNTATDGTDPGADIPAINAALAGVEVAA